MKKIIAAVLGLAMVSSSVTFAAEQLVNGTVKATSVVSSKLGAIESNTQSFGSSRFRGVTTTYSVRHNQINADLRHRARCVEITDLNHIYRNSAA